MNNSMHAYYSTGTIVRHWYCHFHVQQAWRKNIQSKYNYPTAAAELLVPLKRLLKSKTLKVVLQGLRKLLATSTRARYDIEVQTCMANSMLNSFENTTFKLNCVRLHDNYVKYYAKGNIHCFSLVWYVVNADYTTS